MSHFVDFHTHRNSQSADVISVYNLMLHENGNIPKGLYSAGLHPWFADQFSLQEISVLLEQVVADQNLIALGEVGLDKNCPIPMQIQQDIFEIHLKKAVEKNKPVVLHCVKAWEELIELSSGFPLAKVVHGYNGTLELTKRLLNHDFFFSIGKAILHPKAKIQRAIQIIPTTSLFCETDTLEISIRDIYAGISQSLTIKEEVLKEIIFENFKKFSKTNPVY